MLFKCCDLISTPIVPCFMHTMTSICSGFFYTSMVINMMRHGDHSTPPTLSRCVQQKKLLYPHPRVFVCPSTLASLNWLNRFAYLKWAYQRHVTSPTCLIVLGFECQIDQFVYAFLHVKTLFAAWFD